MVLVRSGITHIPLYHTIVVILSLFSSTFSVCPILLIQGLKEAVGWVYSRKGICRKWKFLDYCPQNAEIVGAPSVGPNRKRAFCSTLLFWRTFSFNAWKCKKRFAKRLTSGGASSGIISMNINAFLIVFQEDGKRFALYARQYVRDWWIINLQIPSIKGARFPFFHTRTEKKRWRGWGKVNFHTSLHLLCTGRS